MNTTTITSPEQLAALPPQSGVFYVTRHGQLLAFRKGSHYDRWAGWDGYAPWDSERIFRDAEGAVIRLIHQGDA